MKDKDIVEIMLALGLKCRELQEELTNYREILKNQDEDIEYLFKLISSKRDIKVR